MLQVRAKWELQRGKSDSVLLCLANTHYDDQEYIREYEEYVREMGLERD